MCSTSFSETGSYNLKFISKNGRNEGVYINHYGSNNKNKGKACTEKTDPKNMGTYNFSGMYYAKGKISTDGASHWLYDIRPYDNYGNVSKNDLPRDGEKRKDNETRYEYNVDARRARIQFTREWKGIDE